MSLIADGLGGMSAEEVKYYDDGVWYDAEYVHIGIDIPYYAGVAAMAGRSPSEGASQLRSQRRGVHGRRTSASAS